MFGLTVSELSNIMGWIGGLLGSVTAIYMLTANRRKVDSESRLNTSEAYEKMVNAYEKRITSVLKRFARLEKRVRKLEDELKIKQSIIDRLEGIRDRLRDQLRKLGITPKA